MVIKLCYLDLVPPQVVLKLGGEVAQVTREDSRSVLRHSAPTRVQIKL